MNAEQQWQKLKNNYLKQVENALASTGQSKSSTILQDVNEHLEHKYAELPADKLNWEGYQQILIEMGPPQDYAELLCEQFTSVKKTTFGINELLTIVFVMVLIVAGGYLVYNAQKTPTPTPKVVEKAFEFELDERVLGKWVTIDFVKRIDDFYPAQKSWQGELFLLSLVFKDNGKIHWNAEGKKETVLEWTKGKVDPNNKRPSFYYLRNIEGQTYLFYEWVSGDVTDRGREPSYYVLSQNPENVAFNIPKPSITLNQKPPKEVQPEETVKTKEIQMIQTPIIEEPSVFGKWDAIDCVKNINDFMPNEKTFKKALILKELHFTSPKTVYWNFNNTVLKETSFTETALETINGHRAKYSINVIDGQDYLFVEWITPGVIKEEKEPDYYVLRRQQEFHVPDEQPANNARVINTSPVGRWISVDFVKNIEDFRPGENQWTGDLYLKDLTFFENGNTSGPWTWRQNYLWHPGDRTKSHFTIQQIQGSFYLFMEWMSGDVTIRGQRPAYYVLKKTTNSTRLAKTSRRRDFTLGASYCTANYVRSILGSPKRVDSGGRMLRYSDDGIDFWFSNNGPLSEIHLNRGYNGQLETGVSLASTKQDIFSTYGQPIRTVQADKLSGRNDERILYQKGNASRIYYGRHGLIFWFSDNTINQIVVFKGTMFLN